jgi:hypothetical protein
MSDPTDAVIDAVPGAGQRRHEVSEELSRSLGSIWQRHAGGRPSTTSVEISGDVVKYVMEGAVSSIDTEPAVDESGAEVIRSPSSSRYQNEAIAAVRRITKRRVRGFIPKRDEKSDLATDTYILEPVHVAR